MKGFKNFIMRGDVIVIAIGLIVALAFSNLIASFTTNLINPLINRAQGSGPTLGLGVQLGHVGNRPTFMNFGAFISSVIYFFIFVAVVYFLIVVPYRAIMRRRGVTVFGEPAAVKTCPACLSDDLPLGASKCRHCGTEQPLNVT